MASRARGDLDGEIDALFRLPLAEFTSARNALAVRLRREKRPVEAERVKSLAKPPAPAWAVNQLYWNDPRAIDALLAVAERVRKAQTGRIRNVDVRELLGDKKRMTAELLEQASTILREAGHAASPEAMRRVAATLESLAVWGHTDGAPKPGRLTEDLDPPGFDALDAMLGGARIASAKVLAFRAPRPAEDPEAARARAREAVQAAETVLREARREAARADAARAKAEARIAALEKEKQQIEARFAEAREEARKASAEASRAAKAVANAERALAAAKKA